MDTLHARGRAFYVKDVLSGIVSTWHNKARCAKALKTHHSVIHNYLQVKNQRLFNRQYQFKYCNDTGPWRLPVAGEIMPGDRRQRPIQVRNVQTGCVQEFDSLRHCAQHLHIAERTLNLFLKSDTLKVYKNTYLFRYQYGGLAWPLATGTPFIIKREYSPTQLSIQRGHLS